MYDDLIQKLRDHVLATQKRDIPFAPATPDDIADAESHLRFPLPDLLKALYLNIGNGGFGPSHGGRIIGLRGGDAFWDGTLVEIYGGMKRAAEWRSTKWQNGLLPFCGWGGNIFSSVDCLDPNLQMHLSTDAISDPQAFNLLGFMNKWLQDADLLDTPGSTIENIKMINPFTKKEITFQRRRRN